MQTIPPQQTPLGFAARPRGPANAAWAVVISALIFGVAGPLRIEAAEPVVVVFVGDAAPGGNGTFTDVRDAIINDAGQVAFRAGLANTTGGGNDNRGIFRGDGTTLTQIARLGQPAPDGNGVLAFAFPYYSINNAGQVAFWSDLANTSGGDADDEGIFRGDGGPLIQMFRTGMTVPGGTSTFYPWYPDYGTSDRRPPALNDSGQVAFWTPIDGNSSPSSSDQGIYRGDGTNLVEIARRGGAATGGGVYDHFLGPSLVHNPTVNNAGQVAFVAKVSGKAAIFRGDGALPSVQIYREGMFPSANPDIGKFGSVAFDPMINEAGQVAFYSTVVDGLFGIDAGIFLRDGTETEVVALEGEWSPASDGSLDKLQLPVINDPGQVAFYTEISSTSGGNNDNSAICRHTERPGPDLMEIVRDGETAPGGNGRLAFGATSLEYTPSLNNAGQVAFFAKLTGTTGGNNDNDGIFFFDDALGLVEVAREGSPFFGSTYQSLQFGFSFFSKARESTGLNNHGQVTFRFTLNDGRQGIAIWSAPQAIRLRVAFNPALNTVVISWPSNVTSGVLEANSDLLNPAGWMPVGVAPVIVGNEFQVTVPVGTGQRFFRLSAGVGVSP